MILALRLQVCRRSVAIAAICTACLSGPLWGQSWTNGSGGAIYYTGGNVGIGTTTPGAGVSMSGGLTINGTGTMLTVQNNGTNAFALNADPSGSWTIYDNASGNWTNSISSRGGSIGIGTATPSQLLEVSSALEPFIRVTHTGMPGSPYLLIGMNSGNNAALFHTTSGKDFKFFNGQYALTILGANGNVGVGTTNPQYPLSVNGTIQSKEVIVNTGWADYVFQPKYRLKPLSEVAAFIKANHHLPDIPSEAEVKEKGVSLGDMQAKLLAKIEELTLQMIHLDEKNKQLAQRLGQLEAQ